MPIEKLSLNEQNKRMLHFSWFFKINEIEVLWENKLSSSVEMLKREITRGESEMETCQHRLSVLIIFLSKSNKCDDADVKLCFASFSSF